MTDDNRPGLAGIRQIIENRRHRREKWRAEAHALWDEWRHDSLFIMGVALYWGEGTKCLTAPRLALTNSDEAMLKVWLRWCQRFMPEVALDYSLVIHDSADVQAARCFWKQSLGIDVQVVSIAVSRASKRRRNTLPHGTLKVRVGRGSVEWYTKMLVWLELAQTL